MKSPVGSQKFEVSPRPSSQVDDALRFIRNYENLPDVERSSHAEKRLVKKIDWMLMPLMAAIYNLQYLNKTIHTISISSLSAYLLRENFLRAHTDFSLVNYAHVMGLAKDTNTDASQFSYLATEFYVGYLFCEIPHGYLLQTLPVGNTWAPVVILEWVQPPFGPRLRFMT